MADGRYMKAVIIMLAIDDSGHKGDVQVHKGTIEVRLASPAPGELVSEIRSLVPISMRLNIRIGDHLFDKRGLVVDTITIDTN